MDGRSRRTAHRPSRARQQTGAVLAPKHDKPRTVPMSPRVTETLARLPRRGLWIVSRDDGGALGYWPMLDEIHAVYDRAGVARPPWPMHSLRHMLQRLLGHSEIQTTMRYVDVDESDKREAIAAVFGERCAVAVQSKIARVEKP
jgi:integrase